MNLERFSIKFFAHPGTNVDDAVFIDIFHGWIRYKKLDGILLDVADYRHVPEGPGVMLITHEINFAMDYTEGRFGLLAQRKLGQGADLRERILELARATVAFGVQLESDPRIAGKLKLEAGDFLFQTNDRLLAPNTTSTFSELEPDLKAAAKTIYSGQPVTITQLDNDPRDRLSIVIDTGRSLEIGRLVETAAVN